MKHLKMAVIPYLEVLTEALYQNIPLYYWYIVLHFHFDCVYVSWFAFFLLLFSSSILLRNKNVQNPFLSHYFCNLVCTAFFLLRPFSSILQLK